MKKLLPLILAPLIFAYSCTPPYPPKPSDPIPPVPPTPSEPSDPSNPGTPTNPEPVRNDFYVTMDFSNYSVGDNFNFSVQIQNSTQDDIIIDNISKKSLEYQVLKEGESIYSSKVTQDISVTMHPLGFVDIDYSDNKVKVSFQNDDVTYQGQTYSIPYPLLISRTENADSFTFQESGDYQLQLSFDYSISGDNYTSTYQSGDIIVE